MYNLTLIGFKAILSQTRAIETEHVKIIVLKKKSQTLPTSQSPLI